MGSPVRINLGDAIREHSCRCCGRTIRSGQGALSVGGGGTAVYWFDLHRNGDDRRTRLLVALDRGVSFVVHGRRTPDGLAFSLADPSESPVVPARRLTGRTLRRRRALEHPDLPGLWRVIDAVVQHDPAVATFLTQ